jgi:hypothetical protein
MKVSIVVLISSNAIPLYKLRDRIIFLRNQIINCFDTIINLFFDSWIRGIKEKIDFAFIE